MSILHCVGLVAVFTPGSVSDSRDLSPFIRKRDHDRRFHRNGSRQCPNQQPREVVYGIIIGSCIMASGYGEVIMTLLLLQ